MAVTYVALQFSRRKRHNNLIDEGRVTEVIATAPPGRPDSNSIAARIAEIRDNKISRYEPLIRPEGGLTYTGFSDNDLPRQLDILKTLKGLGLVKEEPFDYIRKCNRCDHHGMVVKVACPVCNSTNTDQGKVVEHLACGNIDLESAFNTEEGVLVCPKCRKRLKAIGVDYVKPGSYCACLSCKALSPEGRLHFLCLNCGSSLTRDELKPETLYAYIVDQAAVTSYLEKTGIQLHLSVAEALRKRGLNATTGAALVGSSQVQHVFDIVVYHGDPEGPALAVQFEKSGGPVDPESLLNFFARCLDARVPGKIFVGVPGFTDEAKKLAGAQGIEAIESAGDDADKIVDRIVSAIPPEQVPDRQLEEMIESMQEAVAEVEEKQEPAADDRASLERMLRTIISPDDDEEKRSKEAG